MNRTHLSDERLIEVSLGDVPQLDEPHLAECERCESRRAALVAFMQDVNTAMAADADRAFPPERLARQHARILQQIEQDGRPARVIAFPLAPAVPMRMPRRQSRRWVAAAGAVAAAFIVGILAGHLTRDFSAPTTIPAQRLAVRNTEQAAPIRTVAAAVSDDELLGQIEAAVGSTGPAALRALDAVTPRAWDVR
jgi:hypothetical protein